MEEDFLVEMADRGYQQTHQRGGDRGDHHRGGGAGDEHGGGGIKRSPSGAGAALQNVEFSGAPWQLDSLEQFPVMGGSGGGGSSGTSAAPWGARR